MGMGLSSHLAHLKPILLDVVHGPHALPAGNGVYPVPCRRMQLHQTLQEHLHEGCLGARQLRPVHHVHLRELHLRLG